MLVHEIFNSIQGEGYHTGKLSTFIRLYGCSVGCSWCDTGYGNIGNKPSQFMESTIQSICDEIAASHVVITGGEPFIQNELPLLCEQARCQYKVNQVQIETSGVYWQDIPDHVWVTLSPKEHLTGKKIDDRFWDRANEFKFIVSDYSDFEYYILKSPRVHLKTMFQDNLYFQPEWNNRAKALDIIQDCILVENEFSHGRLSIQTHKYLNLR